MNSSSSFPSRSLLLLFLLPLLAFPAAFFTAYQGELVRVTALGQLSWAHLSYAEELKDDMAVIDWSKNLERLPGMRAFQVVLDSKVVAQGGNLEYLPQRPVSGVYFLFPSDWSFQSGSHRGPHLSLKFTVVFHSWPGPFFWGLFAFLSCWSTGAIMLLVSRTGSASGALPAATLYGTGQWPSTLAPEGSFQKQPAMAAPWLGDRPYLFIDKNYVIRQVSPEAAGALLKKAEELRNGHLLDLAPDALLIQAFENGMDAKIQKPFTAHPHVSATLKADSNGYWLILEAMDQL